MKTQKIFIWVLGLVMAGHIAGAASEQGRSSSTASAGSDAARPYFPLKPSLSGWANELAKLAAAGLDEQVLLSYVDAAQGTFNLASDQIIYLRDIGVSGTVITRALEHDAEVASGSRPVAGSVAPAPALLFQFPPAQTGTNTVPARPTKDIADSPPPPPAALQIEGASPGQANEVAASAASTTEALGNEANDEVEESPICLANATDTKAASTPSERVQTYPVRAPYPVRLTYTIRVFRTEGRMPNTVFLEY